MKVDIDHELIARFKEVVEKAGNIVIVPHVNPDGDAIGSTLSLDGVLRNLGKNSNVIIPNDFPDFLQWIYGSGSVIDYSKTPELANELFEKADTLFCLDFNEFDRSEGLKDLLNGFQGVTVLIDHHPFPKAKCDVMISYPAVCSTCELLFRVLELAGYDSQLDKNGADAIFTGMMTDTGNFSYNASDPETYHIIAKLLEKGIDKDLIHSNIYHTFSEDRWRLIGHALRNKMVIIPEYRTGYITLSKAELDQFNFQPGDTEGLVNYPLMVKDVVFCVLMMEKDDKVKLSLRSKGSFPTNVFSQNHFGGGGHCNASGGETTFTLEETKEKFLALLPQYKQQLLNSY